ncbi:hypothetical protein HK102_000806 [Quaeritorhiza haematococci]|nr:hypothetical protein HK102_000806 [Quaeritorhiza haematococci]
MSAAVIEDLERLNLRDFIRVYLHVNEVFTALKHKNPANVHSAMYAVRHPETAIWSDNEKDTGSLEVIRVGL